MGTEKPCILITAKYITPGSPAELLRTLEERYTVFFWKPNKPAVTLSREIASRVQAIVGYPMPDLVEALPNLRMIACVGAGFDKLDLTACRHRNVKVSNVPSLSSADVADFAVLLMLACFRSLPAADRFLRRGLWPLQGQCMPTRKASGKCVGILGLGHIGMCIARRAEAFGCSISYCGKSVKPEVPYAYHADVMDLARSSDVMIVACALTEETRGLINRRVLDALGPEGIFVNVARGAVVNEGDLIAALQEGTLGSAALDVFATEPVVPRQLLLSMDNVVLTPHIASATTDNKERTGQVVIANLEAFFSGKPLVTPVLM